MCFRLSLRPCSPGIPAQDWEAQGALSALYLSALRELILLLPDWEGVEGEMQAFLQDGCQAAAACVNVLFLGELLVGVGGVARYPVSSTTKVMRGGC